MGVSEFQWAAGVFALADFCAIAFYLRALKPSLLAAQLTFSEPAYRAVLARWTPQGLRRYRLHFWADYALIGAFGTFGLTLAQPLGPAPGSLSGWLLACAAVADLLENLLHQWFLRSAPGSLAKSWFLLAGCAASLKWLAVVVASVLIFA